MEALVELVPLKATPDETVYSKGRVLFRVFTARQGTILQFVPS